jgi:hypothetical protein
MGKNKKPKSVAPKGAADFSTEEGKHYNFVKPKVIIPGFGLLTKEQALQNESALAYLVVNGCSAIEEVTASPEQKGDPSNE